MLFFYFAFHLSDFTFLHFSRFLDFLTNKLLRAKRTRRTMGISVLVREKLTFPLEMLQSSKLPKLAKNDGDDVCEYNGDDDGEYDGEYEGDNQA